MINHTSKVQLHEGIQLHLVQSDKFKTVLFGLYIKRPLSKEEVGLNALLSRVLDQATSKYATTQEVNQALDMLYGSVMVVDVHKYGEKQMLQLKMQVPGAKYTGDDQVYQGVLALLNDMINSPRLINGGFDPEIVEREKLGLIDEINIRKDQKDGWAMSLCIEKMCPDELYHIHEFGTVEAVAKITPQELYAHLQKLWQTSQIDICIIGDYDLDKMAQTVKGTLKFERSELIVLPREQVVFHPEKIVRYQESHDISQGKLSMGYRVNVPYESPLYTSALIASVLLGGGGSSKLFKNVREKARLCYSVFSRMEKHKSIMLVYAGVDFENFEQAENLIEQQVEDIKLGNFTDEELEIAKYTVLSNIQSVSDYPNSYINYYYNMLITNGSVDIEENLKIIRAVTKQSVIESFADIRLGAVVRLVKEEEHA
ncbi:EF-P 5-aminopentanol modification-associated protein YfmF [Fusibacter bizertensis]